MTEKVVSKYLISLLFCDVTQHRLAVTDVQVAQEEVLDLSKWGR